MALLDFVKLPAIQCLVYAIGLLISQRGLWRGGNAALYDSAMFKTKECARLL